MYYADDYDHQPNQNDNEIQQYHYNTQDHYPQEQTQDQNKNLPTHEPTDLTNDQPPDQDYQYNDDKELPSIDY